MGLATVSTLGVQSVMMYMLIYLVMNIGAFLVVIWVAETTGSESILDYKGLSRRAPVAAVTFAIFLFSLTGLPPFAGFVGKWYLFYAVFERIDGPGGGWYADPGPDRGAEHGRVALLLRADRPGDVHRRARRRGAEALPARGPGYQLMLGGFSAAILLFGVWWTPMMEWTRASLALFRG